MQPRNIRKKLVFIESSLYSQQMFGVFLIWESKGAPWEAGGDNAERRPEEICGWLAFPSLNSKVPMQGTESATVECRVGCLVKDYIIITKKSTKMKFFFSFG